MSRITTLEEANSLCIPKVYIPKKDMYSIADVSLINLIKTGTTVYACNPYVLKGRWINTKPAEGKIRSTNYWFYDLNDDELKKSTNIKSGLFFWSWNRGFYSGHSQGYYEKIVDLENIFTRQTVSPCSLIRENFAIFTTEEEAIDYIKSIKKSQNLQTLYSKLEKLDNKLSNITKDRKELLKLIENETNTKRFI